MENKLMYRIVLFKEDGKSDLFQPEVGEYVEQHEKEIWWRLIITCDYFYANGIEFQLLKTKEEAMNVIILHKEQSKRPFHKEYIQID